MSDSEGDNDLESDRLLADSDPEVSQGRLQSDELLAGSEPTPVTKLPDLERRDRAQDIWLRRVVAFVIIGAMLAQMAVADTAFFEWGIGKRWQLSTAAMDAWLTATVVQVIGLVFVLANYLYQRRDKKVTKQPGRLRT